MAADLGGVGAPPPAHLAGSMVYVPEAVECQRCAVGSSLCFEYTETPAGRRWGGRSAPSERRAEPGCGGHGAPPSG